MPAVGLGGLIGFLSKHLLTRDRIRLHAVCIFLSSTPLREHGPPLILLMLPGRYSPLSIKITRAIRGEMARSLAIVLQPFLA